MRWHIVTDADISLSAAPLAFLDFETTGLAPYLGHRVIAVGVVRCLGETVTGEYQQLVNPERPSEPGALRVHGITPEMVSGSPLFADIVAQVLAMIRDAVVVCHNAPFDLSFLRAELDRARQPLPRLTALDTLALAQAVWDTSSYSLDNLCAALGIRKVGHSALGDARATRQLFWRIAKEVRRDGVDKLSDLFDLQGGALDWRHIRRTEEPIEPPPMIRQAMDSGALLWIRYQDARGAISERMVRPMGVIGQRGQAYLRAFCHLRNQERTFGLERILEMRIVADDKA